jgi:eukaryotic-like serine/threonine-protein kinase
MNDKELFDPTGLVGKRIAGKYKIDEVIDRTDHSIVFRATHLIWKRNVAIKVFMPGSPLEAEARDAMMASFVREGTLLTELSETCSAVCQARDIGSLTTPKGAWMPYMVLEWLEGDSLDTLLSQERETGASPRTIQEVVRLLGPIADALACAHARGITHCDVKPGNIILLRTGNHQCKLFDFGIAKVVRDATPRRSAIVERAFTPGFGAPEQFDPAYGETGPWTDVFALALVVVEMVCGRDALRGQEIGPLGRESCDRLRRPTPRALGIRVNDEVERVLRRALDVDPGRRFADVRAFWSELAPAMEVPDEAQPIPLVLHQDGLIPAAPHATELPRARPVRGHRRWLSAALLSAIAIAVGFGISGHVSRPAHPRLASAPVFALGR